MDENEFLRGIEGEQQSGQDLVSGAEHLIRLKKQVGMTRPADDSLELEKEAESLPSPTTEKTATLKEILDGARSGLKYQAMGAGAGLKGLKMPGARSRSAGMLAGMAAPAAAVGGAAYLAGKHSEKTATLNQHLHTKLASMRETTTASILDKLKNVNPGLLAATGVGAVAGGIGTYLSSRPQKETGKSKAEEDLEGKVQAQKGKPEGGLLSKMHNRNTELEHGYAQAFRDHPGKAAILGAISGGISGYGIGRLAGAK